MKYTSLLLLTLSLTLLAASPAQPAKDEEETELNVTAERMEVQLDGKTVELTNNVRFEDESMVLTSDRMLIFLEDQDEQKKEDAKNQVAEQDNDSTSMKLKRMEAIGKVELRSKQDPSQSAAGNKAVYDVQTDTVVLSGDCVITQGQRTMKGNEVIFDRKQSKIFVKNADIRLRLKRGAKDKGLNDLLGKKTDKDSEQRDKVSEQKDKVSKQTEDKK